MLSLGKFRKFQFESFGFASFLLHLKTFQIRFLFVYADENFIEIETNNKVITLER